MYYRYIDTMFVCLFRCYYCKRRDDFLLTTTVLFLLLHVVHSGDSMHIIVCGVTVGERESELINVPLRDGCCEGGGR